MAGWSGSLWELISGMWTLSLQFSARSCDKDLYHTGLISHNYLGSRALWLEFFQDPCVAWTPCSVSRYRKISTLTGGRPVWMMRSEVSVFFSVSAVPFEAPNLTAPHRLLYHLISGGFWEIRLSFAQPHLLPSTDAGRHGFDCHSADVYAVVDLWCPIWGPFKQLCFSGRPESQTGGKDFSLDKWNEWKCLPGLLNLH